VSFDLAPRELATPQRETGDDRRHGKPLLGKCHSATFRDGTAARYPAHIMDGSLEQSGRFKMSPGTSNDLISFIGRSTKSHSSIYPVPAQDPLPAQLADSAPPI
jgi:hypothetical protein